MRHKRFVFLGALLLAMLVAGCAGTPQQRDEGHEGRDGLPSEAPRTSRADPLPRPEPRSKYGNGPFYQVNGQSYAVMESASGYRERGVASWYGQKFHGRPTSSQEPYDMHGLSAAHKTLPLPTWVRVTNLANGRSVVVRVNDRGPFVDNRIIDLSYAAASKLDMVRAGTSLVEVTAIGFGEPEVSALQASNDVPGAASTEVETAGTERVFVQVGAFGDLDNARRRHDLLQADGIARVSVHEDSAQTPTLYRVRIGPIVDVAEYDSLVARLQRLGISDTHLVTD